MRKQSAAVSLILASLLALTSCGAPADIFQPSGDSETEYVYSDVVYLPMEKVRSLNPLVSADEDTYYISKLVYEPLFAADDRMVPQPVLANSCEFDESGTSCTIKLKKGVKWHDGEELTAADVKFTIEAIKQLSRTGSTLYGDYAAGIVSVTEDRNDEYSLTLKLTAPGACSESDLVFPILPQHQFRNATAMLSGTESFLPVGTGPYACDSYDPLAKLTLTGFRDHRGETPENTLCFTILPDREQAVNLVKGGNISILFDVSPNSELLLKQKGLTEYLYPSNSVEYIGFNTAYGACAKTAVRQAVCSAVDSESLLSDVFLENGITCSSIYYPGFLGVENTGDCYPYSIRESIAILNRAGYLDRDGDSLYEDLDGNEITISVLADADDDQSAAAAAAIVRTLSLLPVNVEADIRPKAEYDAMIVSGRYDMYIGSASFNERYDLRPLLKTNGAMNYARYSNASVDELTDSLRSSISAEEKTENAEKLINILKREVPYYCLFYRMKCSFVNTSFRGEVHPLFNDIYRGPYDWKCAYEAEKEQESAGEPEPADAGAPEEGDPEAD